MESIRRIITGIDEDGRSVFVSDETVEAKVPPLLTGNQVLDLFGSDAIPDGAQRRRGRAGPAVLPRPRPRATASSSSPIRPTRTARRCPTTSSGRPPRPIA